MMSSGIACDISWNLGDHKVELRGHEDNRHYYRWLSGMDKELLRAFTSVHA
jgi:hypothetical protein